MDQTSRLDDGSASGASAKGALAAAAARALDADAADAASSSDDDDDDAEAAARETRLRSYQTADVYIKKAAAKIAGHKKWYADRAKREKASESCAGALEELRLASMVLQRHDEVARRVSKKKLGPPKAAVASGRVSFLPWQASSTPSPCRAPWTRSWRPRRLRADADAAASREADARAELAERGARRSARRGARRTRQARNHASEDCGQERASRASGAPGNRGREREETQKRLCPEGRREAGNRGENGENENGRASRPGARDAAKRPSEPQNRTETDDDGDDGDG